MDTEGARALAERIASGPPQEEGAEPPPAAPQPRPKVEPQPKPTSDKVEIVYLKPAPAPRREVRIYVRGRDGALERQL